MKYLLNIFGQAISSGFEKIFLLNKFKDTKRRSEKTYSKENYFVILGNNLSFMKRHKSILLLTEFKRFGIGF